MFQRAHSIATLLLIGGMLTSAAPVHALDPSQLDANGRIGNWAVLGEYAGAGGCGYGLPDILPDPANVGPFIGCSEAGAVWEQYTPTEVGGHWKTACNEASPCNGGYVSADLNCFYSDGLRTWGAPDSVTAYAFTYLTVDTEGDYLIRSGSDDGYRIWIDGSLAVDVPNACRCYGDQQETTPVHLTAGVHRVLAQVGEVGGHWGFVMRVTQTNGAPVTSGMSADTDGPSIGACCPDADADGLCDADDNCDDVFNPDQLDNDEDGEGDACDDDDDNDSVPDVNDNCQFDANNDQADFDGDGAGDVCDKDDDNDGVLDAVDQCLATQPGEVVNANGCAIAELCPCDNAWKNHGAYVSCVAHTAEDFLEAGLITEEEKDAVVSAAGSSACGHKK